MDLIKKFNELSWWRKIIIYIFVSLILFICLIIYMAMPNKKVDLTPDVFDIGEGLYRVIIHKSWFSGGEAQAKRDAMTQMQVGCKESYPHDQVPELSKESLSGGFFEGYTIEMDFSCK